MSFAERMPGYRARVEAALERWLPPASIQPARFHTAIRYSVLGGGKRLRPLLVYATGEWLGLVPDRLDAIAVAIELVHAYSLVHDDLPAMDDDELRRGRATTHVAFDEATAILVGDALQAHAYKVLAADAALDSPPEVRRSLVVDLARASGSRGMVAGQALDMAPPEGVLTAAEIEAIYGLKTGCLLRAAVLMPCRLRTDLDGAVLAAAERFGAALGLAYQIADDLMELESTPERTGKPRDSDARNNKATLPAVAGVEAARARLTELREQALATLAGLGGDTDGLRCVCDWACTRDH
jgi:farnesyl diphosphate synthase